MSEKYKNSREEAQLQPVAVTVVVAVLSVAGLVIGTGSMGFSPGAVEAYQITAKR